MQPALSANLLRDIAAGISILLALCGCGDESANSPGARYSNLTVTTPRTSGVDTGATPSTPGSGSGSVPSSKPLEITSSVPATLAVVDAASVDQVSITFDKSVNSSSVDSGSFYMTGPSGVVAATLAVAGAIVSLTPTAPLVDGAAYTVTATTALQAIDGARLAANASIGFTTRSLSVVSNECTSSIYANGYTAVTGQNNAAMISSSTPAKGAVFADPNYHTCLVRVTDHTNEGGNPAFLRNDYSRRQAFNADSSRLITYAYNGSWHMYNSSTLRHLATLNGLAGDAEPQWHPTNPDLIYYLPTGGGLTVNQLNVATGARTTVGNFTGRLPWSGAAHVWTKSEGSPSADARHWCFMVDNASWASLGVFVWDMQTDTILGTMATNGNRPDHVSMSPSGKYCIVSWANSNGTVAFDRTMNQVRQLHTASEHSDLALGADGSDYYVSVDYQANDGSVFMKNIDTGVRTNLFATYVNGTATALHISGKGFNKPGWALVSTYASYGANGQTFVPQWLHEKIFAVQLAASPKIQMLAHHHRVNSSGSSIQDIGYWTEPQASVNRDFTRIVFNSNWEVSAAAPEDYMIALPDNAIQ